MRGDIRALGSELSEEELNKALRAYTRRDKYLACGFRGKPPPHSEIIPPPNSEN
ncbi:ProQ/FinO family protein [Sinorhizobium fredii]|uniref:ProQ/FinO family protein n=1 Tax=Rhizobium fredii TaxID=380 RepID=UPI001F0AAAB2